MPTAKLVRNHLEEEAEERCEEQIADHPHATRDDEMTWLTEPEAGQPLKPGDPGLRGW
jgi:hypothetical protein